MASLQALLSGKKTYLATIALGLVGLAASLGWISREVAEPLCIILAGIAGLAVRAAIQKSGPVDPK